MDVDIDAAEPAYVSLLMNAIDDKVKSMIDAESLLSGTPREVLCVEFGKSLILLGAGFIGNALHISDPAEGMKPGCECIAAYMAIAKQLQVSAEKKRVATVRPDWLPPTKPDGDYQLAVINDGGWHPHWYSRTEVEDVIEIEGPTAWPFVEETARGEDWEKLGFEVL